MSWDTINLKGNTIAVTLSTFIHSFAHFTQGNILEQANIVQP